MAADFRSDTVTVPTEQMREAMMNARVGDDVYEEDPTINELEALAALMLGKEAALFTVSGTMGNLVSLLTHTHALRASEVIAEAGSHVYLNEVAGAATLGGVQLRPVKGNKGVMDLADLGAAIRDENIHCPVTTLICVENTHNEAGGVVQPTEYLAELRAFADDKKLPVHMDGARVFNAAAALNTDVKEITRFADSVSVCLSKGLCAPVGAMICGTKDFIRLARRYRKMLGGGMRQAGVLAAAGIVALKEMTGRLGTDNRNARILAEGLSGFDGICIDLDTVQTNIIRFHMQKGRSAKAFSEAMASRGFLFNAGKESGRVVTHNDVGEADIQGFLLAAKEVLPSV
ncbi:MAG: low-specificity L-threonine aldolase [Oscillospiraceae bacterium]|nr:low-specificity L-threonine aldolase [Oscillospiraceae bacterium]